MDNTIERDRKQLIENLISLLATIVVVGVVAKFVVAKGVNAPVPAIFLALILIMCSRYVRKGGSLDLAAGFIIGSVYTVFLVAALYIGGFKGPIVYLALFDRKAGWIGFTVSLLLLSIVASFQYVGWTNSIFIGETGLLISNYCVAAISCLLVTWIVGDYARRSKEHSEAHLRNAETDFLTGLANRRKISDTLKQEADRARRSNSYLSLILVDIDYFKRLNDSSGHQAGDRCLIVVAELLNHFAMRSIDVVGRYGGDEFVVILPSTNAHAASEIAEKISGEMASRSLRYEADGSDRVSLSLGVVSLQGEAIESADFLIKCADEALYYGKDKGRNCVVNTFVDAQAGQVSFERL